MLALKWLCRSWLAEQSPRTPSPRHLSHKLPQWLKALAPPRLVAGSRSSTGRVLIGRCMMASSPLRPADDHCRHPLPELLPGCGTCPRCNPTLTLSDVQYAVRLWGAGRGRHRPCPRSRCGHRPTALNILASSMPRSFGSCNLARSNPVC